MLAGRQRLGQFRRILAAGLREVRPAAASAADELRGGFHRVAGVKLLAGQFFRNGRDQGDLAFLDKAKQDRDLLFAGAEVVDEFPRKTLSELMKEKAHVE